MEWNWIGELRMMKELDLKPNFSDLERRYGIDRHKLKQCYELGKIPDRKKREFGSQWDVYENEIRKAFEKPGVSKIAVYRYLENRYGTLPGTYGGFRSYTLRKNILTRKTMNTHVLYETPPGEQLQFDWKENLNFTLKNGDRIHFNVFSATLGYSREHVFLFTYHKTTDDLIRCLIETFRRLGGTTKKIFTDNMTAIVSIQSKNRNRNPRIVQLCKDLGVTLQLAKVRTPETKGKVENSNKFMNWLAPYNFELETVQELITTIEETISKQCNKQVNQGTKVPPAILFEKEKEYLTPLTNLNLLDSYLKQHKREKVPSTLLVYYQGKRYSVPKQYIGCYVDIYPNEQSIYIYYNKKLVAIHTITQNHINYDKSHYTEALKDTIKLKNIDIEEAAESNLKRLARLGGKCNAR